jgi:hypothetical protein
MNLTRHRHRFLLFCLTFFLCLNAEAQNGFTWKSLKPDKAPATQKVQVLGKQVSYYPLEKKESVTVTVQGPTTLRVLTRIEFGKSGGEKRYYLRYEREDGKKAVFRRSSTASSSAVLVSDNKVRLANSRSVFIKVPEGKHTYRFYVGSKASYKLYLRFYERGTEIASDVKNVAFSPTRFTAAVPVVVKEEEVTYYRLGTQDSIRIALIGPTTIQVLSRLEFDPTMITDQKFRIRVLEDGKEKQVFPLRSKPSEAAEYRGTSAKVLGRGAKFFIEVPKGKHEYRFEIVDNGRSALLRFFIPRKDLTNNS